MRKLLFWLLAVVITAALALGADYLILSAIENGLQNDPGEIFVTLTETRE